MRRLKHLFLLMGVASWCLFLSLVGLSSTLDAMAEAIAEDVGQVLKVVEGDPDRVIFVFEERHDSILVQIEVALMLNRLYTDYGMRHIGLEGLMSEEDKLDLSWAHWPPPYRPGQLITAREDVLVQSLIDGEIGGVELLGLVYDDVVIHGIDDAELYAAEVSPEAWSTPYTYLYNTALARMRKAELNEWKTLYDAGKYQEAQEYAMNTDPFTAEKNARLQDNVNFASAEETLEMLDEIATMAKLVKANLPSGAATNLEQLRSYLKLFSKRTDVMVANTLALSAVNRGVPVAMNIGAVHTERVIELFTEAGVSFIVFRSQAQAEGSSIGLLSREAFDRRSEGLSTAPEGALAALLDGRKKSQPIADKEWYAAKETVTDSLQDFATIASEAAQQGRPFEEILDELNDSIESEPLLGASLRLILEMYGVTDFHVTGMSSGGDGEKVMVEVNFNYTDPKTGEVKRIKAVVWRIQGQEKKPEITFEDRLTGARETFKSQVAPPREEGSTATTQEKTVPVCSGVEGTFTAEEVAG